MTPHDEARRELAQQTRMRDMLHMANFEIATALFQLGLSNNGKQEELIERLYREIWKRKYD
jgi:hypothetical protein